MSRIAWFKTALFIACLSPALYLAWRWHNNDLGINRVEFVARYTGHWTLRLLIATLAISPLRRLPRMNWLIRVRRMLGLFTYGYGLGHGFHYLAIDIQWDWLTLQEDLTYRRFFIAGAIALTLMTPLALTSFSAAIRWMGGRRWRLLHMLIYPAAISASIHYLWQAKGYDMKPLEYACVVWLLLIARVVLYGSKRWKKARAAAA